MCVTTSAHREPYVGRCCQPISIISRDFTCRRSFVRASPPFLTLPRCQFRTDFGCQRLSDLNPPPLPSPSPSPIRKKGQFWHRPFVELFLGCWNRTLGFHSFRVRVFLENKRKKTKKKEKNVPGQNRPFSRMRRVQI